MDLFVFVESFRFSPCLSGSAYVGLVERLFTWLEHGGKDRCLGHLWGISFLHCCCSRWGTREGFPSGAESGEVYPQQGEVEEGQFWSCQAMGFEHPFSSSYHHHWVEGLLSPLVLTLSTCVSLTTPLSSTS